MLGATPASPWSFEGPSRPCAGFETEGIQVAPIPKCGGLLVMGATLAYAQSTPQGQTQGRPADAAALNNSGVALRLASRPAEASEAFNRAVKIAEETGDERLLATALGGLGATLVDLGEFARAQPVLRRSLALFEKTAGPDSIEAGEAANNLAMVYRKNGEFAQAQAQLERALPLDGEVPGKPEPRAGVGLEKHVYRRG